jgi:hypothetical protein
MTRLRVDTASLDATPELNDLPTSDDDDTRIVAQGRTIEGSRQ